MSQMSPLVGSPIIFVKGKGFFPFDLFDYKFKNYIFFFAVMINLNASYLVTNKMLKRSELFD